MKFSQILFGAFAASTIWVCMALQTRQDPMAQAILEAVSKRYKKMEGFSATFSHDSESNTGKVVGHQGGKITVSGSRYVLQTGNSTIYCDGKTAWNVNAKNKEVTISAYEPEPDDITPERVYTFYQRGYKYIFMGEVKVKGKVWQSIDLEPENLKKEITKIRLFVDKTSHAITKWIVYERGSNNREVFEVEQFTPLKAVSDKDFTFLKSAYPGYKIVDLR